MHEKVKIRHMRLQDITQVIRIANQAFIELARLPSRFGVRAMDYFRQFPHWQFVAVAGDEVVGFLIGYLHQAQKAADIAWIATHPSWWSKGIGGKLLDAIEKQAKARGYKKVILGTPFASSFYEKYGYKCVKVEYRMIKELIGKRINPPANATIKHIDLEDIPEIVPNLNDSEAVDFVTNFLTIYESEQDKALLLSRNAQIQAIIIAKTDPYQFDLVQATFFYYKDINVFQEGLQAFEYLCSRKGKRWAGLSVSDIGIKKMMESSGWQESKLPSFWTNYSFEKILA